MKFLLLGVGLAFLCLLTAHPGNTNEAPKRIQGNWYTVGLASNVTSLIGKEGKFRFYGRSLHENADGNLYGTYLLRNETDCFMIPLVGFQTDRDKYYVPYEGNNILQLVSKADDHLLFVAHNDQHDAVIIYLFSKELEASEEAKKKFEDIFKSNGLDETHVVDLSVDKC